MYQRCSRLFELKPVYKAVTADKAERQLTEFETKWPKYPAIARLWREQWERVIPFFAFLSRAGRIRRGRLPSNAST